MAAKLLDMGEYGVEILLMHDAKATAVMRTRLAGSPLVCAALSASASAQVLVGRSPGVHIAIVTAEPRGAYHLHPLAARMRRSPAAFTHLVPYDETLQGTSWDKTTDDLAVLSGADRLVVTGGSYSAWTEAVAWRARALGLPVVFTELAFVPSAPSPRALPAADRVTAMSPSGAQALAGYLGTPLERIAVTGSPQLDDLPARDPQPRRVLMVSTDRPRDVDPAFELRAVADTLASDGWDVLVCPHPREDHSHWDGHLITDVTAARAAASAEAAVGYLGSAAPLVAAQGVPFVVLDPVDGRRNLPAGHQQVAAAWVATAPQAIDALAWARPAAPAAVHHAVGPIGGAAARVVDAWTAAL